MWPGKDRGLLWICVKLYLVPLIPGSTNFSKTQNEEGQWEKPGKSVEKKTTAEDDDDEEEGVLFSDKK